LTNLNLCGNKFGDKGATHIANALCNTQCPALTNLSLGFNKIGNEGVTNIVNALLYSPNLTCLDFRSNMIGDEGIMRLKEIQSQYYNLAPKQLLFDKKLCERSRRTSREA
jgi:Ran GTPase-activating protein (RanGAP) involved in mRNA processing and transport